MKIKANDPEAKNVDAIYVNGKRLATCIEADDEEGYAIVALPPADPVKSDPNFNKGVGILATCDPIDQKDWVKKTITGKVEIVFRKEDGLDDSGLER